LVYKDTCRDALNTTDEEERLSLIATMRIFEESIATKTWLQGTANPEAQSIQDRILTLKKLEFNARYGDYVGRLCSDLRNRTAKLKIEGYALLSGERRWTQISQILDSEARSVEKYRGSPTAKDRPSTETTDAVYLGCTELGLNPELTLWAIRQYARRNEMMHCSLDDLIKDQSYSEVAIQLARDRDELPRIVPLEECETENNMRTIIEALIQEWFDTSENSEKAQAWLATKELKDYSKMLRAKEEVGRIAREEHVKATAITAKKIMEKKKEEELVKQAEMMLAMEDPSEEPEMPEPGPGTGPATTTKKGKGKRLASSEIPREADMVKRQKARVYSWNKWTDMVRRINYHVSEHKRLYDDLKNLAYDPPTSSF
jgi:hypothetical protein